MKIDVITLFPQMFESPFAESMVARAMKNKIVEINYHDMRRWAWNSYGAVDDRPYGGGVGMLIRVDVIAKALNQISNIKYQKQNLKLKIKKILLSARGKRLTQERVEELVGYDRLILICGHYEGVDQRVADYLVDEEISIGGYVLTGGELPAMILIDAVTRLLPGVLGKDESSRVESFSGPDRKIEHPQYTRPREFGGWRVPEELLSGDPAKIGYWKEESSQKAP